MARTDPQLNFRLPSELKEKLESAAAKNNRTTTAEVVDRLGASLEKMSEPEFLVGRRVQVFKNELVGEDCNWDRVPDFVGTFHQFSCETDSDGAARAVAIIERDDGVVTTAYCHLIQFFDRAGATGAAA